jgi:hypothetical protein
MFRQAAIAGSLAEDDEPIKLSERILRGDFDA